MESIRIAILHEMFLERKKQSTNLTLQRNTRRHRNPRTLTPLVVNMTPMGSSGSSLSLYMGGTGLIGSS